MKRMIHPLVLTCPHLSLHANELPRSGVVAPEHMLRFRMDDTISGELSAAAAELIRRKEDGTLKRHDEMISPDLSKMITTRFSDRTAAISAANGDLDQCLGGDVCFTPGFPEPRITMEWHLPDAMTWECRRANMTWLRPGIGNIRMDTPARTALPADADLRDGVQIFLLYPGISKHTQISLRNTIDDQIALWARAAKIEETIKPAVWAEMPLAA